MRFNINGIQGNLRTVRKWWGFRVYLVGPTDEFIGSIARSTIPSSGEVFYVPGLSAAEHRISWRGPSFTNAQQAARWLIQRHADAGTLKQRECGGFWIPCISYLPN